MSLVTRCTSCGTLFKVVADQLKISDGWVRCGQCSTVFDAQSNLVESPPPPTTAAPDVAPPIAANAADSQSSSSDSVRDSTFSSKDKEALLAAFEPYRTTSSTFGSPRTQSGTKSTDLPTSSAALSAPVAEDLSAHFESAPRMLKSDEDTARLDSSSFRPGALRGSDEIESDAGPSTSTWASSEYDMRAAQAVVVKHSSEPTTIHSPSSMDSSLLPDPDLAAPSTTPQMPMPGFVKQAQREQRWRSPWVRLGLGFVGLILLAALAAQILVHDKNRIAAQWPQTKVWLNQFCAYAGCQVQDLKRIESIAVDASSFNRINKNNAQLEAITQSYRLAVTLKNTGTLPVALPHVELSLQDAQDQPILRRVLSPADLGSSLTALAPAQDMAGSLTLQIETAQLAGSKIQGYRVLAFYP
ncbi:zinc-ribbon and DUF3426 domain-containing protein [Variovorax sp. PCZ-1]|uniref:zinc-ribbon and DUF3426 domain-containing protein n=1 Tax=Variovorax sp. PCZ-1 TaxID=2835533 RepID=UPI001BCBB4EF|nr:zinc-ribbon and DUF3426 domain-containing protein [Variovorax sp. PCZ-1]MBS7806625.1 zinc-ribbon and DUF3426 domain-containing protein [Variovorax sp. PCZ-1]